VAVPKSAPRTRSSAGVPDTAADGRIAELEERLARLEGSPGIKERGRRMMDRVMPPEATTHFFNAGSRAAPRRAGDRRLLAPPHRRHGVDRREWRLGPRNHRDRLSRVD